VTDRTSPNVVPPFQRGDFVRVTAHGHTKDAMVGLASPNGRSLMLLFDGGLFFKDGSGYVGSMPVLQEDDGTYRELINGTIVNVEPLRQH